MKRIFPKALSTSADLQWFKHATQVGDVQFHRLYPDGSVDPFRGSSELHDQFTAAFSEIAALDLEVRERTAAIFAKHGVRDHGFTAHVATAYNPNDDKHREKQ